MTAATTTSLVISTVVATFLADDDDDYDHYTCRQEIKKKRGHVADDNIK